MSTSCSISLSEFCEVNPVREEEGMDPDFVSSDSDRELFDILAQEKKRQKSCLNLIAGENYCSRNVLEALSSCLNNDYAAGYPGKRHEFWTTSVDALERLCQRRALEAFHLSPEDWSINVQPHSASAANFAAYLGCVGPQGRIMGLDPAQGGHRTHGCHLDGEEIAGASIFFETMSYGTTDSGLIDFQGLERTAELFRPKLIIAGTSAYPRLLDYGRFRTICDWTKSLLMADMAHIAGFVAAHLIPSPFDFADIVTTTTHKSLRGPRAGLIFCRKSRPGLQEAIDRAVYPAMQSSPHLNVIAAAAVALKEAAAPEFREYQAQVLNNAQTLCKELKTLGYSLATDGTDTHIILLDIPILNLDRDLVGFVLDKVGVLVNRKPDPKNKSPRIRLGTHALTTRGLGKSEMESVAQFFHRGIEIAIELNQMDPPGRSALDNFVQSQPRLDQTLQQLRQEVEQFASQFPMPGKEAF